MLPSQYPDPQYFPRRPQSVASTRASTYPDARVPPPVSLQLPSLPIPTEPVTFPDLENSDLTYDLCLEGLSAKSVFHGFSSLFTPNRGLADLAESDGDGDNNSDDNDNGDGDNSDDGDDGDGSGNCDNNDNSDDNDGNTSFNIVNWEYTMPESNANMYDNALGLSFRLGLSLLQTW